MELLLYYDLGNRPSMIFQIDHFFPKYQFIYNKTRLCGLKIKGSKRQWRLAHQGSMFKVAVFKTPANKTINWCQPHSATVEIDLYVLWINMDVTLTSWKLFYPVSWQTPRWWCLSLPSALFLWNISVYNRVTPCGYWYTVRSRNTYRLLHIAIFMCLQQSKRNDHSWQGKTLLYNFIWQIQDNTAKDLVQHHASINIHSCNSIRTGNK